MKGPSTALKDKVAPWLKELISKYQWGEQDGYFWVWSYFSALTHLPRPSKEEELVLQFIKDEAAYFGYEVQSDATGNLAIELPASASNSNNKSHDHVGPIIIQNHVDMVTETRQGFSFNWSKDKVEAQLEDGWLIAPNTTLGADNGVGVAMSLALMWWHHQLPASKRPSLRLLFTVDEETGLTGATGLDPKLLQGKQLLNLDTEEWGSFYVGCAGGVEGVISWPMPEQSLATVVQSKDDKNSSSTIIPCHITLKGMRGGHSGINIHEQRGNALWELAKVLKLLSTHGPLWMSDFAGGRAHNAIVREASATCYIPAEKLGKYQQVTQQWMEQLRPTLHPKEQQTAQLEWSCGSPVSGEGLKNIFIFLPHSVDQWISFLIAFPHGAQQFDLYQKAITKDHEDLMPMVAMSANLAKAKLGEDILFSLRFDRPLYRQKLQQQVEALANLCGQKVNWNEGYPAWPVQSTSSWLKKLSQDFEELFGHAPKVKSIHAGLECGIITDKNPALEAVSLGPTIQGAHAPGERVEIKTVENCWKLLIKVLEQH